MFNRGILVSGAIVLVVAAVTIITAQQRIQGRWDFSGRPSVEQRPMPANEQEKKILSLLEDISQKDNSGLIVPLEDGRLLRILTETTGAKNVVEIGTYNGYSGLWFCLALKSTGGKLITHEIEAKYVSIARENFKQAGVDDIVTVVQGDAHETVKKLKEPIDILFIDADKPGYIDYLNQLLPLVRPGGLILAHNVANAGSQMQDYIEAITKNPNLETLFLNMQSVGISITLKKHLK
jgi:caffeoyl-CoA O-methyltransferase